MLSDELNSLRSLSCLRTKHDRIRALRTTSISVSASSDRASARRSSIMMNLAIDLTIWMVQIRQFHNFHFGLSHGRWQVFGQLGRTGRISGRRQCDVRVLHHPPESGLLGSSHHQQCRQDTKEYSAYHLGHPVGPRSSEVPVDDHHRHEDTHRVHDEGEEQVLGDQRQHQRRRRKNLAHQQQKHHKRQEDTNSKRYLFRNTNFKHLFLQQFAFVKAKLKNWIFEQSCQIEFANIVLKLTWQYFVCELNFYLRQLSLFIKYKLFLQLQQASRTPRHRGTRWEQWAESSWQCKREFSCGWWCRTWYRFRSGFRFGRRSSRPARWWCPRYRSSSNPTSRRNFCRCREPVRLGHRWMSTNRIS